MCRPTQIMTLAPPIATPVLTLIPTISLPVMKRSSGLLRFLKWQFGLEIDAIAFSSPVTKVTLYTNCSFVRRYICTGLCFHFSDWGWLSAPPPKSGLAGSSCNPGSIT
ncbi:unnamed protein product [Pipistrellus nathusii]|uniref:Uncharacterized protein n=1 Tax=Pipistrellus nathusii TaxID=59473 RepID=A0ABP0AJ03_PIPNA